MNPFKRFLPVYNDNTFMKQKWLSPVYGGFNHFFIVKNVLSILRKKQCELIVDLEKG